MSFRTIRFVNRYIKRPFSAKFSASPETPVVKEEINTDILKSFNKDIEAGSFLCTRTIFIIYNLGIL